MQVSAIQNPTSKTQTWIVRTVLAAGVAALVLYAYRGLLQRPFAADDYQWLLRVRDLDLAALLAQAFALDGQSHFYRPVVWLLFWVEYRLVGLIPAGYHAVSLGLHMLNAALTGWLAWRLVERSHRTQPITTGDSPYRASSLSSRLVAPLLVACLVAFHPAPFEAVVWVSAQSELLAATLLLLTLHLWLPIGDAAGRRWGAGVPAPLLNRSGAWPGVRVLLATLALGLALLTKESAVIGLALLVLIGAPVDQPSNRSFRTRFAPFVLPGIVTAAYLVVQIGIERRNEVVQSGGYGPGSQILLNPLRSLALIVAPLPGSEHADGAWLIPLGAAIAIGLGLLVFGLALVQPAPSSTGAAPRFSRRLQGLLAPVAVLLLTLLPTAPFASPPDSRYLYLPVLAAAVLAALGAASIGRRLGVLRQGRPAVPPFRPGWAARLGALVIVCMLAWYASVEVAAREARFATASAPGDSLWKLALSVCAGPRLNRMLIVDPPLAAPHAEAIVALACGDRPRPLVVARSQVVQELRSNSIVVSFVDGQARVEQAVTR